MERLTTEQKQLLCECVLTQMEKSVWDSYTRQKCEELLGVLKEDLNTQIAVLPT
jgi:hypothetical protein